MAGPTRDGAPGEDPRGDDVDTQWADLTARLGELRLPPPGDDEADVAPPAPAAYVPPAPGPRDYAPREPGRGEDEDEDAGRDLVDGFSPPDPDPLTDAHPVVALGWTAVVLGVAVMFLSAIVWQDAPALVWLFAVASLVAASACSCGACRRAATSTTTTTAPSSDPSVPHEVGRPHDARLVAELGEQDRRLWPVSARR